MVEGVGNRLSSISDANSVSSVSDGSVVSKKSKLGSLAIISTGLVVKRKQAGLHDNDLATYKMLTLRSFDRGGWLNTEFLEGFDSNEILDKKYLTRIDDVVIRLSAPHTSILINETNMGYIIPSLFIVIRLLGKGILPEYLCIYLNSDKMKRYFSTSSVGTTIQTISTSTVRDIDIEIPTLERQKKIVEIHKLVQKEKSLLDELVEHKVKYHNELINRLLGGCL